MIKSKRMIAFLLIAVCIASLGIVTYAADRAGTPFDVTSSNAPGQNPSDPWTSYKTKSADGDPNFYVTVYSMSGSCNYVKFFAQKQGNTNVYNTPLKYYRSRINYTVSQPYSGTAPANVKYRLYMEPPYGYANINVTGRFSQ